MPGYFPKETEILFIGANPGQLNKRESGWDDAEYAEDEDWSVFQQGYAKGLFEAPMGKWIQEGMGGSKAWSFTNVIKCRTPENKAPNPEEIGNCRPWLEQQISLKKPKAIVTLGGTAWSWFDPLITMDRVLGTTCGISRHFYEGIIMPLYHPAYLRYKHDKFTKMYFEKLMGTVKNRQAYRIAMINVKV